MGNQFDDLLSFARGKSLAEEAPAPEPADGLAKFFEDSQVAGALGRGGHRHVENIHAESRETDQLFRRRFEDRQITKSASDGWDEEIGGEALEKTFTAAERRKNSLKNWLRDSIADGASANELILHAERTDPQTANLLRQIAAELAAQF